MSLRNRPRLNYDQIQNHGLLNAIEVTKCEGVTMLQLDSECEIVEDDAGNKEIDPIDAAYLFLTEVLGWKEGLSHSKDRITELMVGSYLFITEQMNWRKGARGKGTGPEIPHVLEGKARWKNQGARMRGRQASAAVHPEDRGVIPHSITGRDTAHLHGGRV